MSAAAAQQQQCVYVVRCNGVGNEQTHAFVSELSALAFWWANTCHWYAAWLDCSRLEPRDKRRLDANGVDAAFVERCLGARHGQLSLVGLRRLHAELSSDQQGGDKAWELDVAELVSPDDTSWRSAAREYILTDEEVEAQKLQLRSCWGGTDGMDDPVCDVRRLYDGDAE